MKRTVYFVKREEFITAMGWVKDKIRIIVFGDADPVLPKNAELIDYSAEVYPLDVNSLTVWNCQTHQVPDALDEWQNLNDQIASLNKKMAELTLLRAELKQAIEWNIYHNDRTRPVLVKTPKQSFLLDDAYDSIEIRPVSSIID